MRVVVRCQPDEDPTLDAAPAAVSVRPGTLSADDVSQLRRVLHELVTTRQRIVTVDFSDVDDRRRTNVVGVLVGAAREGRSKGSFIKVQNPPPDQRRALFVAGMDEVSDAGEADYEVLIGNCEESASEPVAV